MLLLQEGATVSWDSASTCCYSTGGGCETLVAFPVFLVAFYVYWRHLRWMVARLAGWTGWRATKYWFPTMMLAASALALWSTSSVRCGDDLVLTLCSFFNWPAIAGASITALFLAGAGTPEVPLTIAAVIAAWATWHVVIRWMEVRREEVVPLTLNLGRPGGLPYKH